MATYTKPLKSIQIMSNGMEEAFVVNDTIATPVASQALDQFLHEKTMVIPQGEETAYIPFHAVVAIVSTQQSSDEINRDPYGCEEEASGEDATEGGSSGEGGR